MFRPFCPDRRANEVKKIAFLAESCNCFDLRLRRSQCQSRKKNKKNRCVFFETWKTNPATRCTAPLRSLFFFFLTLLFFRLNEKNQDPDHRSQCLKVANPFILFSNELIATRPHRHRGFNILVDFIQK